MWDQTPDHRYTSHRGDFTVTPRARSLVVSVEFLKLPQTRAMPFVAGFILPALPFSLLVRDSYGVKNTRLTIRRLPRSFVILANYPVRARARAHTDRQSWRRCKSRRRDDGEARISDSRRVATITLVRYTQVYSARLTSANRLICKLMIVVVEAWKCQRKLHRRVDTDYYGVVMRDEASQKNSSPPALQYYRGEFHTSIGSLSRWQIYSTIYSTNDTKRCI